jgi:hypothetical protein
METVIEKCKLQSDDASLLETVYAKDRYPIAYASYMYKKKANDALTYQHAKLNEIVEYHEDVKHSGS